MEKKDTDTILVFPPFKQTEMHTLFQITDKRWRQNSNASIFTPQRRISAFTLMTSIFLYEL